MQYLTSGPVVDGVRARLTEIFGSELYQKFKQELENTGAICSGSFVAQVVLGENWKSDIDFFVPATDLKSPHGNPTSKLDEFLLDNGFEMANYQATARYGDNMSRGEVITWIRDFTIRNSAIPNSTIPMRGNAGCKIQLIHTRLQRCAMAGYIIDNFDFSICKNVLQIVNGAEQVYIYDMQGIIEKRFTFEWAGSIHASLQRKKRYEKRGFTVDIDSQKVVNALCAWVPRNFTEEEFKRRYMNVRVTSEDITGVSGRIIRVDSSHDLDLILNNARHITGTLQTAANNLAEKSSVKCSTIHPICLFNEFNVAHFHFSPHGDFETIMVNPTLLNEDY